MQKFYRSHPDVVLVALALVFIVVLCGFYWWAVNDILGDAHKALMSQSPESQSGFNIPEAAGLDLRGLSTSTQQTSAGANPQASSAAPSSASPTSSISTSTAQTSPTSTI